MSGSGGAAREPEGALAIPELSLVLLIGVSGSGKSSFAARHFGRYEVLSSDAFRGMVSNDEESLTATPAAFAALHHVAAARLRAGLLTVVDATNVQASARQGLIELAREHDVLPVAIVLDLPAGVCIERDARRSDRRVGSAVIKRQHDALRRSLRGLGREGLRTVHILGSEAAVDAAAIVREPLRSDLRDRGGPFDLIGDVHGCRSELETLLTELGYRIERDAADRPVGAVPPPGRTAVFVGDLVDRGPDSAGVLRLVMGMVAAGHALAVPGNHEERLVKALRGRQVNLAHGLEGTLAQLAGEPAEFRAEVERFCDGLVAHLVLDGGRLVVAHAGLKQAYHGRASARVRAFALYGDVTGEVDELGLPVRRPWQLEYRGEAAVVYGHTAVSTAEWVNNTLCLDTGAAFGGRLTALRYPERELVSVPAEQVWASPPRPLAPPVGSASAAVAAAASPVTRPDPRALRIDDVLGGRRIDTRWFGRVSLSAAQAAGALEVIGRWSIDPAVLLHLPPTMSPVDSATHPAYLEHPAEALSYYRAQGVEAVIGEQKHMGSRALVLLARDGAAFGRPSEFRGAVHTRTGRRFFERPEQEREVLERLHRIAEAAGLWAELGEAAWLLLDGELLPWWHKAEPLIRGQYAAVSAAANAALPAALDSVEQALAVAQGPSAEALAAARARLARRADDAAAFRGTVLRFAGSGEPLRLAPFQLLAAEGATFAERPHAWHLALVDRLLAAEAGLTEAGSPLLQRTERIELRLDDPAAAARAEAWWLGLTEQEGAEGVVFKPAGNRVQVAGRLLQPGLKVRGREYLRLIYGPEYTEPTELARLKERNLGRKRSLAIREYALGLESLERFVAGEPLWRVHEAVFGVLALEAEPVDPRL